VRLVQEGVVVAADGGLIRLRADTLCIHGDGPDPVGLAKAVREALERAGIHMARFSHGVDNPPV
jgi:UPF0271 protein